MADVGLAILGVLRSFDEAGRPAPPIEQLAALTRQRLTTVRTCCNELLSSSDILPTRGDPDAYEITARGRTTLARAEQEGRA